MNSLLTEYFYPLLIGLLLLLIISTIWMNRLAQGFFTMGKVRQSFSIFDLEFPSSSSELMKILQGMSELPTEAERPRAKAALRGHLSVDFLFMAAVYPLIALLCWKAGEKMGDVGEVLFYVLIFAQGLAWVFDIAENLYLFRKLANPDESEPAAHARYLTIVKAKWLLALLGLVCALSGLLFFWITGNYSAENFWWIISFILLLFVGPLIIKRASRKAQPTANSSVHTAGDAVKLGIKS